jgi:hypothetical protein
VLVILLAPTCTNLLTCPKARIIRWKLLVHKRARVPVHNVDEPIAVGSSSSSFGAKAAIENHVPLDHCRGPVPNSTHNEVSYGPTKVRVDIAGILNNRLCTLSEEHFLTNLHLGLCT